MVPDTNQEALTHKETSTWSRMPNVDDEVNEVHAHRLCDGYLDLLKFGDGEAERKAKMASSSYTGPISALLIKAENKEKGSVNLPTIKYDATDERSEARSQCMARRPLKKKGKNNPKEKVKVSSKKPEGKGSAESPITVPKWDEPEKGQKDEQSAKPYPMDARTQRIFELNRIYNEYLKAWQNLPPKSGTPFNFSGVKLSALTDLLNFIEHFQEGNLVKDLAKKISQEMEPNLPKQINQDAHLVSDSKASLKGIIKNDLSALLENVKSSNSSKAFKEILADIKSRRSQIKPGELYNEYKKGFCKILSDQKHPRHLDVRKASKNPPKTSKPRAESYAKNKDYLRALEAFIKLTKESNRNGGSKPYYLPMADTLQLVHNDIPLVKPKKSPNKKNHALHKANPSESNNKDVSKQETTSLKKPVQKYVANPGPRPWKNLYSGFDSRHIANGMKAINQASFFNLLDEYQRQVDNLNQALKNTQSWWKEVQERQESPGRKSVKRNTHLNNPPCSKLPKRNTNLMNPGPMPFPEVLLTQASQTPANVLGSMASQMNVSPIEMARRIVGAGQPSPALHPRLTNPQMQLPSQLGGSTVSKEPEISSNIPCQAQDSQQKPQQQQQHAEISPILDKILERLETIQATKCNKSDEEEAEKNLPCCFVDPADGAPCDLNGSWESLVLGIRINIKSSVSATPDKGPAPTCAQPKSGRTKNSVPHHLLRRQCAKKDPTKVKPHMGPQSAGIPLNVSVQETVPPRAHDLLDNLNDWQFSGIAQMILGGPLSLSFRKNNSNLIGHFVGYCRTCGCLETIFGSWTFCQPSRDCQDISMSIVDRRDMLRRYSMDERRKNRYKEQLFLNSKFGKMEAERLRSEQEKAERQQPQAHNGTCPKS
ncbi:hypothetical protein KR054_006189 [Drosophila jambulina]|nr:hypothetical protein KR054_006189 [Drosophila jambulina]